MKKLFLMGWVLLSSVYFYTAAAQTLGNQSTALPTIHRMFLFGDSLTDTGNLYAATKSLVPSSKKYFMGRFSDGYTWGDELAANYRTTVKDNKFILDYAVAGATAFPYEHKISIFHPLYRLLGDLENQLNQVSKKYNKFEPTDLILIWIGANDISSMGDMYFCGKLTKTCIDGQVNVADQDTIVQWAAAGVKEQVQRMEQQYGAQHIIILGLPDPAMTPSYIFDRPAVAAIKSADVKSYNDKLKTFVSENQKAGHDIAYYDMGKVLEGLIHNKAELDHYQITDVIHSCLFSGPTGLTNNHRGTMTLDANNPLSMFAAIPELRDALPDEADFSNNNLQQFQDKSCGDHYLFWDMVHPTKKGHLVLMQYFLDYLLKHFNVSRTGADTPLCYNLQVTNKGWYVLGVSQANSLCGPKNTSMLMKSQKLISVEYNKPIEFKAKLGQSTASLNLQPQLPIIGTLQGAGAKVECTGVFLLNFSCKQVN